MIASDRPGRPRALGDQLGRLSRPGALVAALDDAGPRLRGGRGARLDGLGARGRPRGAAGALAAAGHVLDATPTAMVLDLAALAAPDPDGLDWDSDAAVADVTRINDLAYGWEVGTFGRRPDARPPGSRCASTRRGSTASPACVSARSTTGRLRRLPGRHPGGAPGPRARPPASSTSPSPRPASAARRPRASRRPRPATRCTRGSGTSRSARSRCGSAASEGPSNIVPADAS